MSVKKLAELMVNSPHLFGDGFEVEKLLRDKALYAIRIAGFRDKVESALYSVTKRHVHYYYENTFSDLILGLAPMHNIGWFYELLEIRVREALAAKTRGLKLEDFI